MRRTPPGDSNPLARLAGIVERGTMLQRVLETEVMDSPEEAADYDSMDHAIVNAAFVDDFLAEHDTAGRVLDVGTGTARIPIVLCRRSPGVVVDAVDASASMLELARRNIDAAGLADRIAIQLVDARRLPFADSIFAAVISNSIVHHIPDPREIIAEMIRVTAPGGTIFIRDLMRPADDAAVGRLVDLYAGDATPRQRRLFDDSLRAALSLDEIRRMVESFNDSADRVAATSDRHWTFSLKKPTT